MLDNSYEFSTYITCGLSNKLQEIARSVCEKKSEERNKPCIFSYIPFSFFPVQLRLCVPIFLVYWQGMYEEHSLKAEKQRKKKIRKMQMMVI